MDISVAIDKIDKLPDGWAGVCRELEQRGIAASAHSLIHEALYAPNLDTLADLFVDSPQGQQGIAELRQVLRYAGGNSLHNTLRVDFMLARGLSYYTGCIFEVVVDTTAPGQESISIGSIGGGGRYADLTSMFGLDNMPGVGVSFGAERIYDVMEELQKFPANQGRSQILFVAMDEESHLYAFQCAQQLRHAGIPVEVYPEPAKIKKQLKYANTRQFPYVAIIGENERLHHKVALKQMDTGEQSVLSIPEVIQQFNQV